MRNKWDTFCREAIFWGKPQLSVNVMNGAFFVAFASWFGLMFMPLRLLAIAGLWIVVLQNSDFAHILGQAILKKLREVDTDKLIRQTGEKFNDVKRNVTKITYKIIDVLTAIYEILSPIISKLMLLVLYIATIIDIYIIQKHRERK